jgi:hypothetical protein
VAKSKNLLKIAHQPLQAAHSKRHLTAPRVCCHVVLELTRKSSWHGQHPSSGSRNHQSSGVTPTPAVPTACPKNSKLNAPAKQVGRDVGAGQREQLRAFNLVSVGCPHPELQSRTVPPPRSPTVREKANAVPRRSKQAATIISVYHAATFR